MNRKALIAIVVVAALVPVYVLLAWLTGQAAHARVTAWEQEMTGSAGQLFSVAERKTTRGLFSSTEEITLEFNRALFEDATNGDEEPSEDASMDEEAAPDDQADMEQPAYDSEAAEEAGETPDADEESVDPGDDETAQAAEPWRVTIRNEIQHGPLPGFTSVGIARIESRLVLEEATRKQLKDDFGVDDPFVAVTRLGFLGGGSTKLTSPAVTVRDGAQTTDWKGIEGEFEFGRNLSSVHCAGSAPGLESRDTNVVLVTMEALEFECDLERVFDELYTGTAAVTLKSMHFKDPGEPGSAVNVENVRYALAADRAGDYLDTKLELGMKSLVFEAMSLSDLAYNLSLNHLHGPTAAEITRAIRAATKNVGAASAANPAAAMAVAGAFAQHLPVLLEHSPELVIDRIGFRMPEGEFGIEGSVKMIEFKREDLAAAQSPLALLGKLDAGVDIWISEALLRKNWSGTAEGAAAAAQHVAMVQQQVAAMEQAGYVRRNGGRLEARIEFRNGALTSNGKPLGPPM
jgi:uncharacterized protein YdgA (DUF945 family)